MLSGKWGPLTVSSTGNKAKRHSQSVGVASLRWCFCCQLADRSDAVVKTKEGLLTRWQGIVGRALGSVSGDLGFLS